MKKINRKLLVLLILSVSFWGCSDSDDESGQDLITSYQLAGTYRAQITPTFMSSSPITTGEHTIKIEDLGNGSIRLFFDKFQKEPMPFQMTVDINMKVSKGSGNTLVLTGENGTFKAEPPSGGAIDPNDVPPGIQLPEGSEGGMTSSKATIKGKFGEIEKDGKTAMRFDLDLTPGIALPIQILIYTHEKSNNH